MKDLAGKKRDASEVEVLREELNDLLKKHLGLESEFKNYQSAIEQRFDDLVGTNNDYTS